MQSRQVNILRQFMRATESGKCQTSNTYFCVYWENRGFQAQKKTSTALNIRKLEKCFCIVNFDINYVNCRLRVLK